MANFRHRERELRRDVRSGAVVVRHRIVASLGDGSLAAVNVAGADLVVANVDGSLLAYRDRCASCDAPLHDGLLLAGALSCPECARSFFLPSAGRSMDDDRVQLEPVPLLREEGRVKVALTR